MLLRSSYYYGSMSCYLHCTAVTAQLVVGCLCLGVLLALVGRRLRLLVSLAPLGDDEGDDDDEDDDQHQQDPHPGGDSGSHGAHLGTVGVMVNSSKS